MAKSEIPLSNILVFGAIMMELGGGLLLMVGYLARWAALALFFYTLRLWRYYSTPIGRCLTRSSDGRLDVRLSAPGSARIGTNPEQLFAAGWSACFESAIALAAAKRKSLYQLTWLSTPRWT